MIVQCNENDRSSRYRDQVVPGPSPCPASPGFLLPSEKTENLVPFVGLNNLGNTCYLNSVLQVGQRLFSAPTRSRVVIEMAAVGCISLFGITVNERRQPLLQVLYYCPGLRDGMKKLHKLSKRKAKSKKGEEKSEQVSSFLSSMVSSLFMLPCPDFSSVLI